MSIEAKISRLSLDLKNARSRQSSLTSPNGAQSDAPESWDDVGDEDEPVVAPGPSLKKLTSTDNPAPPPPTPISPQSVESAARKWETATASGLGTTPPRSAAPSRGANDRRPEKSTAAANRMIAGALGIKTPKKTEEQRQYDRAIKEAEIKRRNREREEQEKQRLDDERAKAAVWED